MDAIDRSRDLRLQVAEHILALLPLVRFRNGVMELSTAGSDPRFVTKEPISCPLQKDVGLNVFLDRDGEGWMQVFWSGSRKFDEASSLRRWYPAGAVKAQFAFPLQGRETYFRIDPMEKPGAARIKRIEVYCL